MDTTDPDITFDEKGICNHCRSFEKYTKPFWKPGTEKSSNELKNIIKIIKEAQKDQEYDAIIGLSGGVDSSYLAYWAAKEAGLRLLAVHVDGGWNSELAVQNIEKIVKTLNIDLYTDVIDWEAMRDVQLAFFKAGVANQDTPQDHAFFASLYNFAIRHNIRYVLNGSNIATESILPTSWGHEAMDASQIKAICRKYAGKKWKKFPLVSFFKYYLYFPYIKKMEIIRPLNYLNYNKDKAIEILEKEIGWKYYGGKHYESRFTKFFQGYWLPEKFGFDKRKAHLSSLILSDQITRDEALKELQKSPFDKKFLQEDIDYIAKKLEISTEEFLLLMKSSTNHFKNFDNHLLKKKALFKVIGVLSLIKHAIKNPKKVLKKLRFK